MAAVFLYKFSVTSHSKRIFRRSRGFELGPFVGVGTGGGSDGDCGGTTTNTPSVFTLDALNPKLRGRWGGVSQGQDGAEAERWSFGLESKDLDMCFSMEGEGYRGDNSVEMLSECEFSNADCRWWPCGVKNVAVGNSWWYPSFSSLKNKVCLAKPAWLWCDVDKSNGVAAELISGKIVSVGEEWSAECKGDKRFDSGVSSESSEKNTSLFLITSSAAWASVVHGKFPFSEGELNAKSSFWPYDATSVLTCELTVPPFWPGPGLCIRGVYSGTSGVCGVTSSPWFSGGVMQKSEWLMEGLWKGCISGSVSSLSSSGNFSSTRSILKSMERIPSRQGASLPPSVLNFASSVVPLSVFSITSAVLSISVRKFSSSHFAQFSLSLLWLCDSSFSAMSGCGWRSCSESAVTCPPGAATNVSSRQDSAIVQMEVTGELCRLRRRLLGGARLGAAPGEN